MAISAILYGSYIDTVFALQDFGRKFTVQLVSTINAKPPVDVQHGSLVPKYNSVLLGRYKMPDL